MELSGKTEKSFFIHNTISLSWLAQFPTQSKQASYITQGLGGEEMYSYGWMSPTQVCCHGASLERNIAVSIKNNYLLFCLCCRATYLFFVILVAQYNFLTIFVNVLLHKKFLNLTLLKIYILHNYELRMRMDIYLNIFKWHTNVVQFGKW